MTRVEPAAKLRSARALLDLTQREAGDRAGVSQYVIWALENGKIGFDRLKLVTAAKVARAVGLTAEDFIPPSFYEETTTEVESKTEEVSATEEA